MKTVVLFLLAFLLCCCAPQTQEIEVPSSPEVMGRWLEMPQWFSTFPEGDFALGTAKLTLYEMDMMDAALQNATVNYSRNQNCYVVNNRAIRNTELSNLSGEAQFKVVVSSEPRELRKIYKQLKLVDHFWFYDNFIGLYGLNSTQVDTSRSKIFLEETPGELDPKWYTGELKITSSSISTDVQAHSHDLNSALRAAFEKGRVSLAGYNKLKVEATTWKVDNIIDKLVSLETLIKMDEIKIEKISARRYMGSGGPGYQVHLRLETRVF